MQRAHEVLYYVGLGEARYRNLDTYSTGMKQRIKLAQSLVHDPDLLFLDEPTNGMDPAGREDMLELVRDIVRNKGINLILSSHLLPDVESTCDHVVVLDKGAVAAQGPIAQLKGHGSRLFEVRLKGDRGQYVAALAARGVECPQPEEEILRLFVPEDVDARLLFQVAAERGFQVRHLRASTPTLEDVFASAVNR
jgi:ABC-2 type transport system ATP-binding protein